jgi:predicted RNase H-like HicB family nuclease
MFHGIILSSKINEVIEMSIKVTVIIQKEENWYVAKCVENNIASQGKTIEEAIDNLTEALQLYYEDDNTPIEDHQTLITTLEVAI